MEIVVSTTIFATSVTIMMVLFNYTLKINRQVDAFRQSAQGTRNFAEFLVREIRNGKIDYTTTYSSCQYAYDSSDNKAIAIINRNGEPECFYEFKGNLFIEKAGVISQINPPNLTLDNDTFRFVVRPTTDPHPSQAPYPGEQPFVVLMGKFMTQVAGVNSPVVINYETAVSPDVYDIPHAE